MRSSKSVAIGRHSTKLQMIFATCIWRDVVGRIRPPAREPALSWQGRPQHDIRLQRVDFRYAADRPLALRGVTLRIAAGTTVGLVGPSGCGKTTLVEIILGLLVPANGTVIVDGIAIDESTRAPWQAAIGYVPQQSYLFDASLAENVALATAYEHIDLEQLRESVRLAQLDEFVKTLPNGYREVIGERGVRLSGGHGNVWGSRAPSIAAPRCWFWTRRPMLSTA